MMEFGLGLGVARQMSDAMNHAINNMQAPGVGQMPVQRPDVTPDSFYVVVNENVAGPLNSAEFAGLVRRGDVTADTLVWRPGTTDWLAVKDMPEAYKVYLLNTTV